MAAARSRRVPLILLLGVVVVAGVWAWLAGGSREPALKVPQLAVVVEFDDLADQATRVALASLQADIGACGLHVLGPETHPLLLPVVKDAAATRRVVKLSEATAAEYAAGSPYLNTAGYASPRVLSEDARFALIRGIAQSPEALEVLSKKVSSVLTAHRGRFKQLWSYSAALGMTDAAAKARINERFGVETIRVLIGPAAPPSGSAADAPAVPGPWDPNLTKKIQEASDQPHVSVRTTSCNQDLLQYMQAVAKRRRVADLPISEEDAVRLLYLGDQLGMPWLGKRQAGYVWVEFGVTAEGEDSLSLERELVARFANLGSGVEVRGFRTR